MQRTIVVKIGGGERIDPARALAEVPDLVRTGTRAVIVHGASHETSTLSEKLGHPPEFITSPSGHTSRRTDRDTIEIFQMACCGRINKAIVESLRAAGVDAIGLSGLDGGLWTGTRKTAIRAVQDGRTVLIRDDLSGRVERVDHRLLSLLLRERRTPVLCPPAISHDGLAINVDADRAAAATAAALHADELLLLSNVPGVLHDPDDPGSLIRDVATVGFDAVRDAARGRMKNKVLAAAEAITGGVARVVIGSAGGHTPIASARHGAGTRFQGVPA